MYKTTFLSNYGSLKKTLKSKSSNCHEWKTKKSDCDKVKIINLAYEGQKGAFEKWLSAKSLCVTPQNYY